MIVKGSGTVKRELNKTTLNTIAPIKQTTTKIAALFNGDCESVLNIPYT